MPNKFLRNTRTQHTKEKTNEKVRKGNDSRTKMEGVIVKEKVIFRNLI